MNKKTKVRLLWALSFFIIFLLIWTILHFVFENLENQYKGLISAGITVFILPKINEYETQSGKQIQLKWLFFKNSVTL